MQEETTVRSLPPDAAQQAREDQPAQLMRRERQIRKIHLTIGPPRCRRRLRRLLPRSAEIEKPWKILLPHSKPLLLKPKRLNESRIHKGTVLKITASHVVVDIGSKSEGLVPVAEVHDSDGNPTVQPGDEIDVMVQHGEVEEGYVALSYQKAQRIRVWEDIEKAYNDKTPIKGK